MKNSPTQFPTQSKPKHFFRVESFWRSSMVDLSTLNIAYFTFIGWILSLFFAWALIKTGPATHFSSMVPSWTLTPCVAWLSFFLSIDGFFFKSCFFVFPLLDSLNIQLGISPPWLSSSLLLPLLVLAQASLWSSAFQSGSGNIWHAPLTLPIIIADTHLSLSNVLCRLGNPDKHWPVAHRSECGLPSSQESRPYPQPSMYFQYLIVPLMAVHSCRSDHHYFGHSKQQYIASWLLGIPFKLLFLEFPLDLGLSTFTQPLHHLHGLSHHCSSLLLSTLANKRQTLLKVILARTDFCRTFLLPVAITLASVTL